MIAFWIVVFLLSLLFLVKSSDYLVDSARAIGDYFKLPTFVSGVLLVGVGTSLPELASSLAAVFQKAPDMVVANVLGSNLANTLLIVGLMAILSKNIKVSKDLIDLDIPLLLLSSSLFFLLLFDGSISAYDAYFLLAVLLYYLVYSVSGKKEKTQMFSNTKPAKEFLILFIALATLVFSAKFLVGSLIHIGEIFNIPASSLALFALAIGTSLPEFFVSLSSIKKGHADLALGNIFGSNIFNILAVASIPALVLPLPIDGVIYKIALPTLALSTLLFAFSGISRKINAFEGVFFIIIYVYVMVKTFALI